MDQHTHVAWSTQTQGHAPCKCIIMTFIEMFQLEKRLLHDVLEPQKLRLTP